jgi:hypothetical protein
MDIETKVLELFEFCRLPKEISVTINYIVQKRLKLDLATKA